MSASAIVTAGTARMDWKAWSTSCASATLARPTPHSAVMNRDTAFISLASIAQVVKEANIRSNNRGEGNDSQRNVAGRRVGHCGGGRGGGHAARARQVSGGRNPHLRQL